MSVKLSDDTWIAGTKTVADWAAMKTRLEFNPCAEDWTEAFDTFFKVRLETRYFAPVRQIEALKTNNGEGFAIVALHCTLIEFLASTMEGKTYRHKKKGDPPYDAALEYLNSGRIVSDFLEKYEPYRTMFSIQDTAAEFYSSVRCGLLHEARTKGGWRIRVDPVATSAVDTSAKIIYRDRMQAAFDQFIAWYGQQLTTCKPLQIAFIRKFESLCVE
jgi:hypothetical protein